MFEAFSLIGKITIEGVETVEHALAQIDRLGKNTEKTLNDIAKRMEKVGTSLSKYVTLPLSVAGGFVVKLGMDFKQAMAEVQAISGATTEELAKLEEKARELGATTRFSAREAASALKYMAMAGWQTEQILSGIDGVMKLAAASGEDLALVSDIVTDALTAFNMTADQSTQFADLLANTARNANTNIAMLGESFKYVAPVFGSLGYSAEDAALALGLMANAGIKGSQAGTSLRAAITRMVNATGEAAAIIDELGLKLTDAQDNMIPFQQVMDQLRQTFSNLTSEQQAQYASLLFGQEAMSGMLAIINASEEDYRKLTEATREYSGAAEEMAEIVDDTLKGHLARFKSALEELAQTYYDTVEPVLIKLVDFATKAVEFFTKLPEPIRWVVIILGTLLALAGPTLIVISKMISAITTISNAAKDLSALKIGAFLTKGIGLLGKIVPLITKIIAVVKAVAAAIAGAVSGPIAIAIAVVTALAAAAFLVIKNWDKVKDFFGKLWEGIKEGFSAFVNWFVERWEGIKEFLAKFNLFEIGRNIILSLWEGIKSFFGSLWEGIRNLGQGIIGVFKDVFGIASPSKVFMGLGEDIVAGLEEGLLDNVGNVANGFNNVMSDMVDLAATSVEEIEAKLAEIDKDFSRTSRIRFSLEPEQKTEYERRRSELEEQLERLKELQKEKKTRESEASQVIRQEIPARAAGVQEVIHRHEGVIRVEGVSHDREFRKVVELVVEEILASQRRELRMA